MHYISFGLFSYSYALSVTVFTLWMAPSKMFYNISIGFNEAKTNCRIAQVLALYCGTVVTFLSTKKICHLSSLKKLFRSISEVYQLEMYIISSLTLFNPCNVHENFSMGLLAFLCTKNKLFFFFHSPVFKDLVDAEIDHNSRVVVIATSKSHDSLHPSLLTSRGCHIFQCCVELHPPDANQRQEMLHAMINTRFPLEDSQELELR